LRAARIVFRRHRVAILARGLTALPRGGDRARLAEEIVLRVHAEPNCSSTSDFPDFGADRESRVPAFSPKAAATSAAARQPVCWATQRLASRLEHARFDLPQHPFPSWFA
jgi:hypothetical protein